MCKRFTQHSGTVVEPMFREAFRRRRCTTPASGFLDWTEANVDEGPHLFSAGHRMRSCHDCMPAPLGVDDVQAWLDGSFGAEALRPAAESALRDWIASSRVDRTGEGDDDPTLVEPMELAA